MEQSSPAPSSIVLARHDYRDHASHIIWPHPDDSEFPVFVHNYRKFGPNAPVTIIGPEQAEAFIEIRNQVQCLVDTIRRDPHVRPPSFLKLMVERDELDETALGNLIYMFEGSHFDLYSLWRWIVKRFVPIPDFMRKVQSPRGPGSNALL